MSTSRRANKASRMPHAAPADNHTTDTSDSSTVDEDQHDNDEESMDQGRSSVKLNRVRSSRTSRNNNNNSPSITTIAATKPTTKGRANRQSASTIAAAAAVSASTSETAASLVAGGKTKVLKKKKKSLRAEESHDESACSFSQVAKLLYQYDLRKCDQDYLEHLFTALPQLKDIWDRIGFNAATQQGRLENFYHKMSDLVDEIVEGEEDLEENILESIEEQKTALKNLCFDLSLRYEDLKSVRSGATMTILDLDQCLRGEIERLTAEKRKRLDEFKKYLAIESDLCDTLVLKKTEQRLNIPSESDIENLRQRCKELEKLLAKKRAEMEKIKEECVALTNDLEISRSDTFAELILLETVDQMKLGDEDIQKAIDFRDDLVRRHREMLNEIASLRVKIKELWSKLKITNADMVVMVNSDCTESQTFTKRTLIGELTHEHERCVQIKMENMQKFIEAIRADIREICARMYYSDKQMKQLNQELLGLNEFTEQLLEKHEELLEDLRFKFDENASLFEKVGKWSKLWSEFVQFEEKTKDPQRFKQRGYNMLEEEKQRKVFNTQLPKLEEELTALTREYREMNGGGVEFTIYGLSFADFVHTKRVDYEESKELERKEKQIMRDTIKKNETRFGSKPVTPLALRNKRKLGGIHDGTHLNTPGAAHRSKLQRTEMQPHTPSSRVVNVARGLHNTPGNGTVVGGGVKVVAARAIGNPKRKSRTPGKSKARRSRILANQSKQVASAAMVDSNDTLQSTGQPFTGFSAGGDSTLKTTLSAATTSTTSLFQSTLSSTSTTTNLTTQSSASFKMARQAHMQAKQACPPLSASSKYASTNCLLSTQVQRMTSTASNTFIEEENAELVETTTMAVRSSKDAAYVTKEAAARINEMIKTGESGGQMVSCEVNYAEFSRPLSKLKFGQESTNTLGTRSTSQLPVRSQLPRATKK